MKTITTKTCKGHGRALNHGCGQSVAAQFRKYGLCHTCYRTWALTTPAGIVHSYKLKLKPSYKTEKPKKTKSPINPKILKRKVRNAVHRHVKIRDKHKPCISCKKPWNNNFHAGHYFKAETHSGIKYDLENIHGQCPECNINLDGNFKAYSSGIQHRITKHALYNLRIRATIKMRKYTTTELLKILETINQIEI